MDTPEDIQKARFVMESYFGYQMPERSLADLAEMMVQQCKREIAAREKTVSTANEYIILADVVARLLKAGRSDV